MTESEQELFNECARTENWKRWYDRPKSEPDRDIVTGEKIYRNGYKSPF